MSIGVKNVSRKAFPGDAQHGPPDLFRRRHVGGKRRPSSGITGAIVTYTAL